MFSKKYKIIILSSLLFSVLFGCNNSNENTEYYDKEEHFEAILNDYYFNGAAMDFFDENGNLITNDVMNLKDDYINNKEETLKIITDIVCGIQEVED